MEMRIIENGEGCLSHRFGAAQVRITLLRLEDRRDEQGRDIVPHLPMRDQQGSRTGIEECAGETR